MVKIVSDEKIDLVIPIYEEIIYLSKERHRFPSHCQIFSQPFEMLNDLHNKWLFYNKQLELGIEAPQTVLINSKADLKKIKFSKPFALKASYSRASVNIKKVYPHQPLPDIEIEPHNPWVAQEWLEGERFCSYSICHNGAIKAHALYPVHYAVDGHSCMTFESVHHSKIYQWIENFIGKINFSGQIAFDFFETPNHTIYAIECNPRATSGLHLFDIHDGLDKAFFNTSVDTIFPKVGSRRQLAIAMAIYGWKKSSHATHAHIHFLKTLLTTQDVIFNKRDIKPFLLMPFVFTGVLLQSIRSGLSFPATFVADNEWNGELGLVVNEN